MRSSPFLRISPGLDILLLLVYVVVILELVNQNLLAEPILPDHQPSYTINYVGGTNLTDGNNNNFRLTENYGIRSDASITLWSRPIPVKNVSSIELRLRIIAENATDNHAGVVWSTNSTWWYAFLRPNSIGIFNDIEGELVRASINARSVDKWYILRISFDNDNNVNIYLDGKLIFQLPNEGNSDVTHVGARNYLNIVEFDPVLVRTRGPGEGCNTCYLSTKGIRTIVSNGTTEIYDDVDSAAAVQKAMVMAKEAKGAVIMLPGTYEIKSKINLTENTRLMGSGPETILNFSSIGKSDIIGMAPYSTLENLVLTGNKEDLANDFTQRVRVSNNTVIRNITIERMGYGIETAGIENITIEKVRCKYLKSKSDWASCLHADRGTNNLKVRDLNITNSNRGIEVEDGASNVFVENAYLENVRNFAGTGHEAFSVDAHNHLNKSQITSNILFKDIFLKNSFAPTTELAWDRSDPAPKNYSYADLPRNITFLNVTLISPISSWKVHGQDVLMKDISIINSSYPNFIIYNNSKDIRMTNITSGPIFQDTLFAITNTSDTFVKNLTIEDSRIFYMTNKSGATMILNNVDGFVSRNNLIANAPNGVIPMNLTNVRVDWECGNVTYYRNGTVSEGSSCNK